MSGVLRAVLVGQMPSGKNQIGLQFIKPGFIHKYPKKRFELWRSSAYAQLDRQRGAWGKLATPAKVTVQYTKGDLLRRDVPGMMDALCNLLEWCPVHRRKPQCRACRLPFVLDDALLEAWTWERPGLDRTSPQLQITIEPYMDVA